MSERHNATLQKVPSRERSYGHGQRRPFPSGPAKITHTILEEFKKVTKRPKELPKSYICHYDLQKIWKKGRIQELLYPDDLPDGVLEVIQKRMFVILSILVAIGATECLAQFRSRLFQSNSHDPRITDNDIPIMEKDKIDFLRSEPALQEQFFTVQHKFKPVVINLGDLHEFKEIDSEWRLPFECIEDELGSGISGNVERVAISARYFKEIGGADYEQVYKVACKKVQVEKSFADEGGTLRILKESLTSQNHILKHLATIKHGRDCYILLPLAQLGDLHQFLHCGRDIEDDENFRYSFKQQFREIPDPGGGDVAGPLLKQCWALANAVHWLHSGIVIESDNNSSKVFCAHMDLKPDNILIQPDNTSIVGKWMISDFGISVIEEIDNNKRRTYQKIGSVRDWYDQLTMNTRPKREVGTYQAPEVKFSEKLHDRPSHLTADQRGIGRKSDIWSYGCIFSEILAWALGRDTEVDKFNRMRRARRENNYFFDPRVIGPATSPEDFTVRVAVCDWLNWVQNDSRSPHKWARCWARTIEDILIVSTEMRPDAERLEALVAHVKHHQGASLQNVHIQCSHLCLQPRADRAVASIKDNPSPVGDRERLPEIFIESEANGDGLTVRQGKAIPLARESGEFDTNSGAGSTFAKIDDHDGSTSPYLTPVDGHGIFINSDIPGGRTAQSSYLWSDLQKKEGFLDIAISHSESGTWAAFLTKEAVQIYKLDLQRLSVSFSENLSIKELYEFEKWRSAHLAFGGQILAVWGYCTPLKQKMLYIRDLSDKSKSFYPPRSQGIEMLNHVTVSPQGVLALVCREKILVLNSLNGSMASWRTSQRSSVTSASSADTLLVVREENQCFAHAAFNDGGSLLFAWAYGSTESLYVWRVKNGVVERENDSESHYVSEERGGLNTKVIPYNTYQGCMIASPEKKFFPAQIRGSMIGNIQPLNRQETRIRNFQTGCVFQDHSLVALEQRTSISLKAVKQRYLKEYQIEYLPVHFLHDQGKKLCPLTSKAESSSHLRVIKAGDNPVAVICNLDGTIELIGFTG